MIRKIFLPFLVLFCIFGTLWADNSVDIPDVHVGDTWKYRNLNGFSNETTSTFSYRIVRVDDKEIVFQMQTLRSKGESWRTIVYANREGNVIDNGQYKFEPFYPDYKFPLSVGKTWNQEFKSSDNRGNAFSFFTRAKIVALEKVTAPAGTFDAYRIEHDEEARSDGEDAQVYNTRIIIWYAPVVKKYVRRKSTTFANGRERSRTTDELLEYSLQENLPAASK